MENSNQYFDVIISGGGLSGSLMALSLSQLSKGDGSLLSIAIIETQPFSQTSSADENSLFDERVLALSHGSARYLAKLGVWQYLKDDASAITDIDISDRGHFAKARLTAKEYGVNALGYVIEMALIGKGQLKALSNNTITAKKCTATNSTNVKKNIHWFSPDSIADINWQSQEQDKDTIDKTQVKVTLNSGKILSAKLLLGCDGAQSPVRKLANIDVTCDDYQQVALIANVSTSKAHHHKAFERFTEFGPIAMLPLKSLKSLKSVKAKVRTAAAGASRCSLVWTMTPAQAAEIKHLSDDDFKVKLERAFGSYLGAITHVGKRDTYPLVLLQAQQQTYHRMALVGNASHTIHPIAGQGFNLGLRDVEVMADLIKNALAAGQDIGDFALLHSYQMNRAKDQQQVIQLTDSLVTLFANNLPPLILGRNIGLQALNVISPLKDALVKKTMGY
ncbi:2-octaprenyl-6-methoxyphenyl hydroxylase [Colwellia psychrerythraea]|uniref:2-octaprenyl-6-methoxyphenyl hydroxylase n=1 Tax=Colwellia psychrerythraea TaxID=28229 RepID=A0A1Y5EGA0_COLPS|nr:2-octaprenyl-6-methoxyphenyl hydroxylase [Colwellia psychrerythraea]